MTKGWKKKEKERKMTLFLLNILSNKTLKYKLEKWEMKIKVKEDNICKLKQ